MTDSPTETGTPTRTAQKYKATAARMGLSFEEYIALAGQVVYAAGGPKG